MPNMGLFAGVEDEDDVEMYDTKGLFQSRGCLKGSDHLCRNQRLSCLGTVFKEIRISCNE